MRITHITQFSPKKMREKDTLIQQMLRVFALMAFWSYLLLPSTIDQIYSKEEIGETQSKASDSILYNIYREKSRNKHHNCHSAHISFESTHPYTLKRHRIPYRRETGWYRCSTPSSDLLRRWWNQHQSEPYSVWFRSPKQRNEPSRGWGPPSGWTRRG